MNPSIPNFSWSGESAKSRSICHSLERLADKDSSKDKKQAGCRVFPLQHSFPPLLELDPVQMDLVELVPFLIGHEKFVSAFSSILSLYLNYQEQQKNSWNGLPHSIPLNLPS